MSSISTPVPAPVPARRLRLPAPRLTVLLIILLLVTALSAWLNARQTVWLPGQPVTEAAVQDKYGIRITHIAVLADGGLIDFRFQVVDPDKASALFELENRPLLYVEATGQAVDSLYHPPHGHNLLPGQSQYLIYNNHKGAIRSGSAVAVVLGNLRLEHIIAK